MHIKIPVNYYILTGIFFEENLVINGVLLVHCEYLAKVE